MSKKDKETERLEAEQSLYEHYWFDWYYGGRDRNAMIRWLKGNPQHVLEHHVDDLIQHLQNPTRRYLDGKQDPLREFENSVMYEEFIELSGMAYDEKISFIAKKYPHYKPNQIGKIISEQKNKGPIQRVAEIIKSKE